MCIPAVAIAFLLNFAANCSENFLATTSSLCPIKFIIEDVELSVVLSCRLGLGTETAIEPICGLVPPHTVIIRSSPIIFTSAITLKIPSPTDVRTWGGKQS